MIPCLETLIRFRRVVPTLIAFDTDFRRVAYTAIVSYSATGLQIQRYFHLTLKHLAATIRDNNNFLPMSTFNYTGQQFKTALPPIPSQHNSYPLAHFCPNVMVTLWALGVTKLHHHGNWLGRPSSHSLSFQYCHTPYSNLSQSNALYLASPSP